MCVQGVRFIRHGVLGTLRIANVSRESHDGDAALGLGDQAPARNKAIYQRPAPVPFRNPH
jgi:hypothetical protein